MTRSPRGQSNANRQARQERAQEAAINDLKVEAAHRREKTNKLRKLRLEREEAAAARFKLWRERKSADSDC